ncbi:uncharacterized protein PV09_02231 [Verruconis gallopava]|uniref:Uncharacterized protein n=1 Tax=Verruconis gallopava TaxID=253628 RepID=A0A0D2AKM6_9PEZI|nr:uncharacterized protein PV09_02231 [Verruconis gallopava]KIW07388.1 hypothetical protein PV09_02231 [Verruconis gallopava]
MNFKRLAQAALFLASLSSAIHLHERHIDLEERGGYGATPTGGSYQFAPGIQTATGDTCAAAFGNGYQTCREASGTVNRLCYNPSAGQQCCSASWSCPNGSFCMSDGSCCPNGMDPTNCGAKPATTSSSTSSIPSSTWAPSSWSSVSKPHTHNSTTSSWVPKTYATSFINTTSVKVTAAATGSYVVPTSASAPVSNDATTGSFRAATFVGAGVLAILASF